MSRLTHTLYVAGATTLASSLTVKTGVDDVYSIAGTGTSLQTIAGTGTFDIKNQGGTASIFKVTSNTTASASTVDIAGTLTATTIAPIALTVGTGTLTVGTDKFIVDGTTGQISSKIGNSTTAIFGNASGTPLFTINSNATAGSATFGMSGKLTIATGGLTVSDGGITVTLGGATITGNSTITGTLGGLTGFTQASGSFASTVTGTTTFTIPNATESFLIKNTNANTLLGITSATAAAASNLRVYGTSTFDRALTVSLGGVTVTGNSTITGALTGLTALTQGTGATSLGGTTFTGTYSGAVGLTSTGSTVAITSAENMTLKVGNTKGLMITNGDNGALVMIEASASPASSTVTIAGNLTVEGTTTTVESTVMVVQDHVIQAGYDANDGFDLWTSPGYAGLAVGGTVSTADAGAHPAFMIARGGATPLSSASDIAGVVTSEKYWKASHRVTNTNGVFGMCESVTIEDLDSEDDAGYGKIDILPVAGGAVSCMIWACDNGSNKDTARKGPNGMFAINANTITNFTGYQAFKLTGDLYTTTTTQTTSAHNNVYLMITFDTVDTVAGWYLACYDGDNDTPIIDWKAGQNPTYYVTILRGACAGTTDVSVSGVSIASAHLEEA
jgi:hypothetical protein|uniref:Uncharacterized protein n=1 Tax=viral metagenome TaxID=1070528 RepID=A0A6C0IVZ3_9ZZZZ